MSVYALLLITSVCVGTQSVEWWIGRSLSFWVRYLVLFGPIFLINLTGMPLLEMSLAIFFGIILAAIITLSLGLHDHEDEP